jgi:uncharacterized membrane protein YqhA
MESQDPSWLSRVAFATGFSTGRAWVMRSIVAVLGETLLQRFVFWPSAALAFDVFIAIAAWAILLLLSYFKVRAQYRQ